MAGEVIHRHAWCLRIETTPDPLFAATTDLGEAQAVTALGAVYTRRIVNADTQVSRSLPDLFFGVELSEQASFVLTNADGALDPSVDYRLTAIELRHYNRETGAVAVELYGVVLGVSYSGGLATVLIGSHFASLLQDLLPAAVIEAQLGSPFESSASPGAALPVIYGSNVPIKPPNVASELVEAPTIEGEDYIVGYGAAIEVRAVYQDLDPERTGLERLGQFGTAPGSPTYLNATTLEVTGNQANRFYTDLDHGAGTHIRFKTTASAGAWVYSVVSAYQTGFTPHRLVIEDAVLDAGVTDVEIAGDYLINRSGYLGVDTGLVPAPASPQDFTAIKLFAQEDSAVLALVSNPDWPTATTQIGDVLADLIENDVYGLSAYAAQSVNAASVAAVNAVLTLAGLTGAISGALAYDGQQRDAAATIGDLLLMRGMYFTRNSSAEWTLHVDQSAATLATFYNETGPVGGARIKRVESYQRQQLGDAVRNVVLHWEVLGRTQGALARFLPREFTRMSTAACTGKGKDLHLYAPLIRDPVIAEAVAFYVAQKLLGADERVSAVLEVEARTLNPGDKIGLESSADGVSGAWQIHALTKTLSEITVHCFRANAAAYDAPSGVVTTTEPLAVEQRTAPGTGTNLLEGADFSGPYRDYGNIVGRLPQGWELSLSTFHARPNRSQDVRLRTIGGNYLEFETPPSPFDPLDFYVQSNPTPCPSNREIIFGVYAREEEAVRMRVLFYDEYPFGTFRGVDLILTRDATDTNGAGWARWYGRARSSASEAGFLLIIGGVVEDTTYAIDAASAEATLVVGRRPSTWQRHKPQRPTVQASESIVFDGSGSYTTTSNFIPAGAKVLGVTVRIIDTIVLGTATGIDIGTALNFDAWGSEWAATAIDDATSSKDFLVTHELYFADGAAVVVRGSPSGTLTSGELLVTVEYTMPQPATGV